MTSLSLPAAAAAPSPFDSDPSLPTPSTHKRKHSRNPTAAPLPAFSFNPGVVDQSSTTTDLENQPPSEDAMSTSGHGRRASKPPALPNFKFNPGAGLLVEPSPSPTHPVLEEMAMNQQRVSRSARPAPLPAFTFAPGSIAQPLPSPTKSESSDSNPQKQAGGHRRRGSEFVGSGINGNQLISTSPQKHENKPSGPPLTTAITRGHVHRRSQAVSISDIDTSDLIKAHALAKHRAGSGPSTPNDGAQTFSFSRPSPQARQSISYSARSPPSSPQRRGSAPGIRPRVEFADRIDVIPRPLSMISSETEGSTSTIRGGHSLNNSINSIASPTARFPSTMSSPVMDHSPLQRPVTADAAMLLSSSTPTCDRSLSVISLPKRPLSASGSPAVTSSGSPPNKKKHFWFNHSDETSPTPSPQVERVDPVTELPEFTPSQFAEKTRPKTSPERSTSLKPRKYHTWTAGFFSKKPRQRSSKSKAKRTPTPPTLGRRPIDKFNEIFDADDTIVIREQLPTSHREQPAVETAVLPSSSYNTTHDQVTSPILDLDAALGPFGSEERLGIQGSNKGSASRIARLHSSERRGVVDAFGVIHRRTESAPNMPAVNRSVLGVHGHGSSASLAEEVFDEEEEDMFLADEMKANSSDDVSGKVRNATFTSSDQHRATSPKLTGGLGLRNLQEPDDAVLIIDPEEEMSLEDVRSSQSTIEAPMFACSDLSKRPATSPMPFAYPVTQSHYASSTEGRTTSASMISSPDPDHISFEHPPRFNRFGEASPDFLVRPSTDDVPSLSDSMSSSAVPRISSSANTRSSTDQRSASMFIPSTSRSHQNNWKRSSLASLNRLIPGSSNGSKLKFETVPDVPTEAKGRKKTNRISKLMQFWRSKEKD